jgi:hypothetical protein
MTTRGSEEGDASANAFRVDRILDMMIQRMPAVFRIDHPLSL